MTLGVLAYEFPFSDKSETAAKIKKCLKDQQLGQYDSKKIELLRRLKDELQKEVSKGEKSSYFTHPHGKYADIRDFDVPRLTKGMIARHPHIAKGEVEKFTPFSIHLYYLR
ncbi:MAG: hypothetical protein HY077_09495 [Elusimicrobia bacterium]|nr:hypothetical protein [Elusimicrobiota bacterium]